MSAPSSTRVFLAALFLLLSAGSASAAMGTPVTTEITLRNGQWAPLPEAEMSAAAGDAALDEISAVGRLRLVDDDEDARGRLSMELALVGPSETATMTIRLELDDEPTQVSTASISVRRLDYAAIHAALQHVGREAARRLATRLRSRSPESLATDAASTPNDATQQRLFDDAQQAKHALDFDRARVLLDRVIAAEGAGTARLRGLAEDELRYGLPVFEARQALLDAGRPLLELRDRGQGFARAEHLYRQIQAENDRDGTRVAEAQRALDEIAIARRALRQASQANAIARASGLRMMLAEAYAMEGRCPDGETVEGWLPDVSPDLALRRSRQDGATAAYVVFDASADIELEVVCGRNIRIQSPAAAR